MHVFPLKRKQPFVPHQEVHRRASAQRGVRASCDSAFGASPGNGAGAGSDVPDGGRSRICRGCVRTRRRKRSAFKPATLQPSQPLKFVRATAYDPPHRCASVTPPPCLPQLSDALQRQLEAATERSGELAKTVSELELAAEVRVALRCPTTNVCARCATPLCRAGLKPTTACIYGTGNRLTASMASASCRALHTRPVRKPRQHWRAQQRSSSGLHEVEAVFPQHICPTTCFGW
jgi:hypothetical protein